MAEVFERSVILPVSAGEAYDWHARPGAFARLQPPWERVELVDHAGGIAEGARLQVRVRVGPWRTDWIARHLQDEPGRRFVDVQERGPFASWRHEHIFEPLSESSEDARSQLIDRITYALPAGALGRVAAGGAVRRRLERMFRYRHAVTRGDLEIWRRTRDRPRLRIAITGATGMVGGALSAFLTTQGHDVVRLSRRAGAGIAVWNPARQEIDLAALQGVDAVIHLAGTNLSSGRWNAARKREFYTSRVDTTRWLIDVLGRMQEPPRMFLCASATGYYGDTGHHEATEATPAGTGYLADLCAAWEAEAHRATTWGARVVSLRLGVVLGGAGGALATLAPVFRAGLGGPLAGGRAWMSWIALDDVLGAILHILNTESLHGPVNLVAPEAVTNAQFTRTLAGVLRRPAVFPVPAFALRLAVGEMADAALLPSSRVRPPHLLDSGFVHRWPELTAVLRHELGR